MKTLKIQKLNKRTSQQYIKQLGPLRGQLRLAVRNELLPIIKAAGIGDTSFEQKINSKIIKLKKHFFGKKVLNYIRKIAKKNITYLDRQNEKKLIHTWQKVLGKKAKHKVDFKKAIQSEGLTSFVRNSIEENVSLITNATNAYLDHVQKVIKKSLENGRTTQTIEELLFERADSSDEKLRNRLHLIASDQIQTINGQLNRKRNQALGVEKGRYRTAGDKHVRNIHKDLNHQIFDLAKGAWLESEKRYVFPGVTDIRCRCDFAPIIPKKFLE